MTITLLVIIVLLNLAVLAVVFIFRGGKEKDSGVREELSAGRQESASNSRALREEISSSLTGLARLNEEKLENMRRSMEERIKSLQDDNSQKLEKMRQTVDEKLHETLEKRLGESFKQVSDRLEQVHRGLGEMQSLAVGVGDLKKVLSNVKSRGTLGEVQLGNILEQVFAPTQYVKDFAPRQESRDHVEYAIKYPGRDGEPVYLPIDSKFPVEDYQRLMEAQDRGDAVMVEEAAKALEKRIKGEAKDIKDKYLNPPVTTDFGILFLPFEGLYAEVLRRPGLYETLHTEFKVAVCGPTTILAFLNSLQMGFRTITIQKRSQEVWQLLSVIKNEFSKFGDLLDKTQKKLQEAGETIEQVAKSTRRWTKNFLTWKPSRAKLRLIPARCCSSFPAAFVWQF